MVVDNFLRKSPLLKSPAGLTHENLRNLGIGVCYAKTVDELWVRYFPKVFCEAKYRSNTEKPSIDTLVSVFLLRHFDFAQCDATLRTSPGGKHLRGFGISLAGNTCDKRRCFYRWLSVVEALSLSAFF